MKLVPFLVLSRRIIRPAHANENLIPTMMCGEHVSISRKLLIEYLAVSNVCNIEPTPSWDTTAAFAANLPTE